MAKYTINHNFFLNPREWTEKQAYLLGWILSDGHISSSDNSISIRLQKRDKKILEILKDILDYSGPLLLSRRITVNKRIYGNYQDRWNLFFTSKQIKKELIDMGYSSRKTESLIFPKSLNKELYPHFLRGFYDGDGTIAYNYVGNYFKFAINLIGLDGFLSEVKFILDSSISRHSRIEKTNCDNPTIKTLRISGILSGLKFYNFIYKDANFVLKRKLRKFLRLINFCKRKKFIRLSDEIHKELSTAIIITKNILQNAKY